MLGSRSAQFASACTVNKDEKNFLSHFEIKKIPIKYHGGNTAIENIV
jgi:hypothetical protein